MLDIFKQLKGWITSSESDLVLTLGIVLISLISFSAGRLSAPGVEKQPITVEYMSASAFQNNTLSSSAQGALGRFVASKNSTKYHLPECIGARRISEKNKIWFASKEEAEELGYTPASNCPGLQ